MSKYFSAGQYDQEFTPKRLQMYQVAKYVSSKEPTLNKSNTFIANERGHLNDGVRRGESNPFGDFVGTWDLPKAIPGPYHLVRTGRTQKNVDTLYEKKKQAEDHIDIARENLKPLDLQQSGQQSNRSINF